MQPQKSQFGKKKDCTPKLEAKSTLDLTMFEPKMGKSTEEMGATRSTHEVRPHGGVQMGLPFKAEASSATANANGEMLLVPPATPSTAVSKVQPETAPVQKKDKPEAGNSV